MEGWKTARERLAEARYKGMDRQPFFERGVEFAKGRCPSCGLERNLVVTAEKPYYCGYCMIGRRHGQ
jgi:hypothetical protein